MEWWREARFGLFLHWGLYSIPAGSWGERTTHGEWIMTTAQIPVEEYEEFLPQFNPVEFDADAWVRMAKAAGMKYVVITTKHHDGFALYDSAISDYDVMATPFQRDIMAELAEACREHGLKICWYHSIMDWHHPDYLPRRGWEERSADGADFDRYTEYLHAQVTELLTEYGDIGVMWFDGEWESTWNHDYGRALFDLCRSLQVEVIINNRVDVGRSGMAGFTDGEARIGDFDTPEQEIPATGVPGVDWETCMTMNGHWGYNALDERWKSSTDLIHKLIDISSKGGNFLLNVGPRADGTFPPESVERLAEMGRWMDVHSEAIHGSLASPVAAPTWGRVTRKPLPNGDTLLYLHVFDWPKNGSLALDGLGNRVISARLLGATEQRVDTQFEWGQLQLQVDGPPTNPYASVIEVRLEGAPLIYEVPEVISEGEFFVDGMEVSLAPPADGIEVRYTLTPGPFVSGATPPPGVADGIVWDGTPIRLTETTTLRAQSYHRGKPVSATIERVFGKRTPWPSMRAWNGPLGAERSIYSGSWDVLPDFTTLAATRTDIVEQIALPEHYAEENVGHLYRAAIQVPTTGMWKFSLESDDGSQLWVGGRLLIDNDGLHGAAELRGTVALEAGYHYLEVRWFNRGGGAVLGLKMAALGETLEAIPSGWIRAYTR